MTDTPDTTTSTSTSTSRGQWGSKLGFILAASGSAIGLGNIVFFSANAYRFGAGAFYIPYLVALLVVGIPVMVLEFGLGHHCRRAFPESMHQTCGRLGEFVGWFAVVNATFISFYYVTILAWVVGMGLGAFGDLWKPSVPVAAVELAEGALQNPVAFFFDLISSWSCVLFVVFVWVINAVICLRGARGIEAAVKLIVPAMWLMMLAFIVRGVTLPDGANGIFMLFTPDFSVMSDPEVWQGAFSQIFFTLSLGFGIMTAYASYLPKDADQVNNGLMVAFLNCSFEYVAGIAVFCLLFAFAVLPKASTIAMMFFVVPSGIAQFPTGVAVVGVLFFGLLLIAGLSSSISLVEALVSAVIDKFGVRRRRAVVVYCLIGALGSTVFALPVVIDKGLDSNGTLGLTLLDLMDHWAFSYGLLIVGLLECVLLGWAFGVAKLRAAINATSSFTLGPWYDWLIKFVVPAALVLLIGRGVLQEIETGFYGGSMELGGWSLLPVLAFLAWLVGGGGVSLFLTLRGSYEPATAEEGDR